MEGEQAILGKQLLRQCHVPLNFKFPSTAKLGYCAAVGIASGILQSTKTSKRLQKALKRFGVLCKAPKSHGALQSHTRDSFF